jgi:hypothetical protein
MLLVDGINNLAQLLNDVLGCVQDSLQPLEVDVNAIHEFFVNSSATDHIMGFLPEDLVSLVGLPHPEEFPLVKLCCSQILWFLSACKCVLKGNTVMQ